MLSGRYGLALTPEIAALVERQEPDAGPEPGIPEPSDADLDRMAEALLGRHRPATLKVFAYGSLIWKPEFDVHSSVGASAKGWHRSFCMRLTRWRGTREMPGLMMTLDRGGSCVGRLYELPAADPKEQILRLLDREVDAIPPTNMPRWIKVSAGGQVVTALSFVASRDGPAYVGRLPLTDVAQVIALAAGHWGSGAVYLQRTVANLEQYGIRDRNLWLLQELVAREILSRQ